MAKFNGTGHGGHVTYCAGINPDLPLHGLANVVRFRHPVSCVRAVEPLFGHVDSVLVLCIAEFVTAPLPEVEQQRHWLEPALQEHFGGRLILRVRYPPFLCTPDEFDPYDSLAEPGWSLMVFCLMRRLEPDA